MRRLVVGVDVTPVERIAAAMGRHPRFAEKIFTETERRRARSRPERFATRWAAKEAVMKLYGEAGLRIPHYRAIEVVQYPREQPRHRSRSSQKPHAALQGVRLIEAQGFTGVLNHRKNLAHESTLTSGP